MYSFKKSTPSNAFAEATQCTDSSKKCCIHSVPSNAKLEAVFIVGMQRAEAIAHSVCDICISIILSRSVFEKKKQA